MASTKGISPQQYLALSFLIKTNDGTFIILFQYFGWSLATRLVFKLKKKKKFALTHLRAESYLL